MSEWPCRDRKTGQSRPTRTHRPLAISGGNAQQHPNRDPVPGPDSENAQHAQQAITWAEYVVTSDFWNRTLQNWQSEFLAVGAMIAFSIFLRQRGSSESKPVGEPHHAPAEESQ